MCQVLHPVSVDSLVQLLVAALVVHHLVVRPLLADRMYLAVVRCRVLMAISNSNRVPGPDSLNTDRIR